MSFRELLEGRDESMESRAKKSAMDDMWDYVKDELEDFNKDRPEKASFKSKSTQNGVVYYFKEKGAHFWQEKPLQAMDGDLMGNYKKSKHTYTDDSGAFCSIQVSDSKDGSFSIATVIIK